MPRHFPENRLQCADFDIFMNRNNHRMTRRSGMDENDMAAVLSAADISMPNENVDEMLAGEVAGKFHSGKTSSRT